jgi:Flp pilus assembly protein TadD
LPFRNVNARAVTRGRWRCDAGDAKLSPSRPIGADKNENLAMRPPALHPVRTLVAALALAVLAPAAAANEAEVVSVVGKGEAREPGATDWRAAAAKQRLRGGSFVRTGDASTMALLMQDKTQLRLNQNSLVQIKETSASGAPTRLELRGGRAWMNTKGRDANVVIETPNATAAIRGTEWELEVDPAGRTLLAVLSGTVDFSNEHGRVSVGRNEAAIAEKGKAPVKVALTQPRDRVQWVNAMGVEPRRYAEAAKGSEPLRAALAAIRAGDLAAARRSLADERARGTKTPAIYGLLADLDLVAGETERAMATLREGLAIAPRDPELLAQLASAQLVADQPEAARRTVAQARDAETAGILVAQGEVARRDGDAPAAIEAFRRATTAAPTDERGWFALGRALNEQEDTTRARRALNKALELGPGCAGCQGELGTLETFANRFEPAQVSFDQALAANPADYVAHTGLGLLRLKRGDPQGALDAFLRAGVLEPRYARARTFTAVAYYQLGRHADAIATFREAAALDDKDPLPYLFLTQVYTDLFRAGDAVQASREALKRLPFLKSLNQVANDQQGTSNMGYSLAFFGLESWALEVAQQSYSPYLASSHLFLADRYPGNFNKTSELLKGFLTDPTAFGSSHRFATLVPTTGHYGTLGATYSRNSDERLANPYIRLSGLTDVFGRSAYFLDVERGNGNGFTENTAPDGSTQRVKGDERIDLFALGLGSAVTENLGVFGFGTRLRNNVSLRDENGAFGSLDRDRVDAGVRYRFSPTSMTWLKAGQGREHTLYDRFYIFSQDFNSATASTSEFRNKPEDVQLRHSMDLTPRDHLTLGAERARDRREGSNQQVGGFFTQGVFVGFGQQVDQDARLKSDEFYVSYVRDLPHHLTVQADVFRQRFDQDISELRVTLVRVAGQDASQTDVFGGASSVSEWNPRLGVAWTPGGYGVRAAWQRWLQPASPSTLAPVATAGIPIDDRLVAAGGKAERYAVHGFLELGPRGFLSLAYDDTEVRNLGGLGFRIPVPEIRFVDLLRNQQVINVNNSDLLEGRPDFDAGRVRTLALAANWMPSDEWSVVARYQHARNRATIFVRDDDGAIVSSNDDARVPYVPERLGTLGVTWISPWRIYLSAQAVHRSERFADRDNTVLWRQDTAGTLAVFWETADKRWILGAGVLNLGSKVRDDAWQVDARLRF